MPPRRAIKKSELVGFIATECVMSFYGRYSGGIVEPPKVCLTCLQPLFLKNVEVPHKHLHPERAVGLRFVKTNILDIYIYIYVCI